MPYKNDQQRKAVWANKRKKAALIKYTKKRKPKQVEKKAFVSAAIGKGVSAGFGAASKLTRGISGMNRMSKAIRTSAAKDIKRAKRIGSSVKKRPKSVFRTTKLRMSGGVKSMLGEMSSPITLGFAGMSGVSNVGRSRYA